MAITLYYHPHSRAATALWMLEELGLEHERVFTDYNKGAHKDPSFTSRNPMGKLPTLIDGEVVVTETAAIGLYLADRYGAGEFAPALDDPARATYYRWILFGPSVIEPCAYAHSSGWDYKPGSAGWGTHDEMLASIDQAVGDGPWLLGDRFSMADVCFGATLRFMTMFKLLEATPKNAAYLERLTSRPAFERAAAIGAACIAEHNLA